MKEIFRVPEQELLEKVQAEGFSKIAVGAGIISNGKLMIVRRSPNDFLGGIYELPGGGVEEGESIESSLRREVKEEVGLKVERIIGMFEGFDYISELGTKTIQFNFAVVVEEGELRLSSDEHDSYVWVTQSDFEDNPKFKLTPEMEHCVSDFFVKYGK